MTFDKEFFLASDEKNKLQVRFEQNATFMNMLEIFISEGIVRGVHLDRQAFKNMQDDIDRRYRELG